MCIWRIAQNLSLNLKYMSLKQIDVMSIQYSPFNPFVILGGTYSGQILIWDTRTKRFPVMKSTLSIGGHCHPITCLEVAGSSNAHNLISASTDGTLCSWQMDMLSKPLV
jgi:dynein intermediate chain